MGIVIINNNYHSSCCCLASYAIHEAWCKVSPLQTSFHYLPNSCMKCVLLYKHPLLFTSEGIRFRTFRQVSQFCRATWWQTQVLKKLVMVSEMLYPLSCNVCIRIILFFIVNDFRDLSLFTTSSVHGKTSLYVCGCVCVHLKWEGKEHVRKLSKRLPKYISCHYN